MQHSKSALGEHAFDRTTTIETKQKTLAPPPFGLTASEKESPAHSQTEGNTDVDFDLNFTQPNEKAEGEGTSDAVAPGVIMGPLSLPNTATAYAEFGVSNYLPSFASMSHKFENGKCLIRARLDVKCPWGTNPCGRIDVSSGNSDKITKANYEAIKADLMPSAASPHYSPRNQYYSKALVERHEQFHGIDSFNWTRSKGLALVKQLIKSKIVQKGEFADRNVSYIMKQAIDTLKAGQKNYYEGNGSSHASYAGEIRAYADGRPHYVQLANAVEARGKNLK